MLHLVSELAVVFTVHHDAAWQIASAVSCPPDKSVGCGVLHTADTNMFLMPLLLHRCC